MKKNTSSCNQKRLINKLIAVSLALTLILISFGIIFLIQTFELISTRNEASETLEILAETEANYTKELSSLNASLTYANYYNEELKHQNMILKDQMLKSYIQVVAINGSDEAIAIEALLPYAFKAYEETEGRILPSVFLTQAIMEGGWANLKAFANMKTGSSLTYDEKDRMSGTLFGWQQNGHGYVYFDSLKEAEVEIEAYKTGITNNYYKGCEAALRPVEYNNRADYEARIYSVLKANAKMYNPANPFYASHLYKESVKRNLWLFDLYVENCF